MTDRRGFVAAGSAALIAPSFALAQTANPISNDRPAPGARAFVSPAVERAISGLQRRLGSSGQRGKLARMVANCLPNSLDTAVRLGVRNGLPDTFVITGDIDAMWLRDSTAQIWPYLRFANEDSGLRQLIRGVVERQTSCVLLDPYANAFNRELVPSLEHADDATEMKPGVFERKWELDSLCSVIRLAQGYWRATGDPAPFGKRWCDAMRLLVRTMRVQQRKAGPGPYRFQRRTSWNPDSVPGDGYGNPIRPVGLIVSVFRPSDDATIFPFLVPANMYAVVSLRQLSAMLQAVAQEPALVAECEALAREVERAIGDHAWVDHPRHGRIWAYEVDGYGNSLSMDDANVPSLLSLPYLGWCPASDPRYRATRALVLSSDNPWFHSGPAGEGVGSPHTPGNRIWPISVIMRALTSTSETEIAASLAILASSDAGTDFMHEAFDASNPARYSRPWFAWANSLFGELMLTLAAERPRVFDLLN